MWLGWTMYPEGEFKTALQSRGTGENENLPSCVHVLHKKFNLVISRYSCARNDKEMAQQVSRTCRVIVLLIRALILRRSR